MSLSRFGWIGRENAAPVMGLAALTALAWTYIAYLSLHMDSMASAAAMPSMRTWTPVDLALLALMWSVMMTAMMVPSATPMILMFDGIQRRRLAQGRAFVPTVLFLLGYLAVWSGFSILAALLQWWLHRAALLSPTLTVASSPLGGGLLILAGLFQFTPLKHACLSTCRSPFTFLTSRWREGRGGAFLMGLDHGRYCAGCCWPLMTLLFVAGVMNLLWVAALSALVFLEKLAPFGRRLSQAAGIVLVLWGAVLVGARLFV